MKCILLEDYLVLILPMRNGNVDICFTNGSKSSGSYPTYEEWKQRYTNLLSLEVLICSYPTYEEWKQEKFLEMQEGGDIQFLSYL